MCNLEMNGLFTQLLGLEGTALGSVCWEGMCVCLSVSVCPSLGLVPGKCEGVGNKQKPEARPCRTQCPGPTSFVCPPCPTEGTILGQQVWLLSTQTLWAQLTSVAPVRPRERTSTAPSRVIKMPSLLSDSPAHQPAVRTTGEPRGQVQGHVLPGSGFQPSASAAPPHILLPPKLMSTGPAMPVTLLA